MRHSKTLVIQVSAAKSSSCSCRTPRCMAQNCKWKKCWKNKNTLQSVHKLAGQESYSPKWQWNECLHHWNITTSKRGRRGTKWDGDLEALLELCTWDNKHPIYPHVALWPQSSPGSSIKCILQVYFLEIQPDTKGHRFFSPKWSKIWKCCWSITRFSVHLALSILAMSIPMKFPHLHNNKGSSLLTWASLLHELL